MRAACVVLLAARTTAFLNAPVLSPVEASCFSSSSRSLVRRASATAAREPTETETIDDVEAWLGAKQQKKIAAVYAVYDKEGNAQYVGVARDARAAVARHVATQAPNACASVRLSAHSRPSRAEMSAEQTMWLAALGPSLPPGNADPESSWSRPPLSEAEAERKLKLRQAIADDALREDDPAAWTAVIQKAMKDGDFDGSELDRLDQQIADDAKKTARSEALRRAAGDWQAEIERQSSDALRPAWQTASLEMYTAKNCPHCDRMRAALATLGAFWTEHDVAAVPDDAPDDVVRRARHARIETVPQLYVLREPPLNGRPAEWLVGGADDLEVELKIPESTAFSFKGRISDPVFD